jgi:RimJ/RimL family protein N-acetyltransferase
VSGLLEGKNVNLRVMEKEDLPLFAEWINKPEFCGEYNPLRQMSKTEAEKMLDTPVELKPFIIEKKDGSKIGFVAHYYELWGRQMEIGYALVPNERGKAYCSEAVKIMVDYLFLSRDMVRIQAHTEVRNVASQKVLEKVGFKKEGTLRKSRFERGQWGDWFIYSIPRDEWKEPKILTRKTSK